MMLLRIVRFVVSLGVTYFLVASTYRLVTYIPDFWADIWQPDVPGGLKLAAGALVLLIGATVPAIGCVLLLLWKGQLQRRR